MASTGDLRSLLGTATFSSIPNNTAVVLQQAWSSHTDTLKAQLEKVKVDGEWTVVRNIGGTEGAVPNSIFGKQEMLNV